MQDLLICANIKCGLENLDNKKYVQKNSLDKLKHLSNIMFLKQSNATCEVDKFIKLYNYSKCIIEDCNKEIVCSIQIFDLKPLPCFSTIEITILQ